MTDYTSSLRFEINHIYNAVDKVPGKEMIVDKMQMVNLTDAYGAGNEPTLEYIKAHPEEFAWTPNPNDLIETVEIKNNLVGDLENLQGNDFEQHEDGVVTYTNEAEEGSVVRVDIDGISDQPLRFRNATGDFIASPECVNDIKDLGNSIDVVSSVGRRNLIPDTNKGIARWRWNVPGGTYTKEEVDVLGVRAVKMKCVTESSNWYVLMRTLDLNKVKRNTTYTLSMDVLTSQNCTIGISIKRSDSTNQLVYFGETSCKTNIWKHIKLTATTNNIVPTDQEFYFTGIGGTNGDEVIIANLKMEESSVESNWTPALEDSVPYNTITNGVYKTNILLSAPLRSVGAVKDRLFKDSDGKWKVERNVGEKVFNGTENFDVYTTNPNKSLVNFVIGGYSNVKTLPTNMITGYVICSHFAEGTEHYTTRTNENITAYTDASASFVGAIKIDRLSAPTGTALKAYLAQQLSIGTPVTIQYLLATPTYETLPQELQTKLDNIPTFPEHNYVYTVTNDNLQPTLHVDYKKLSWLKSRLLLNSLKIYSRNLTDAEMIRNYKVEKERFGM